MSVFSGTQGLLVADVVNPGFRSRSTQATRYAYQCVLAAVFLSCCAPGLFNIEITRIKRRPQQLTWILMHVPCATVTLILSAYHIYIVYYYS